MDQDPDNSQGYVLASFPTKAQAEQFRDQIERDGEGNAYLTVEPHRRDGWRVVEWTQ
jgi:hypothetical protein